MLLLDEPAAALGVRQTKQVLELIRGSAKENGLSVIFISHDIPQVLEVADRITVLTHGRVSMRCQRSEASVDRLVRAMSGFVEPGLAK